MDADRHRAFASQNGSNKLGMRGRVPGGGYVRLPLSRILRWLGRRSISPFFGL